MSVYLVFRNFSIFIFRSGMDKRFYVRSLINPKPKTFYQNLMDECNDSKTQAYWNKKVGQVRDPTPGLPVGFDYRNTTMGRKNVPDEPAGLLITPNLTYGQVSLEQDLGLPLYRISHGRTLPGEKKIHGSQSIVDPNLVHGITERHMHNQGIDQCLQWFNQKLFTATSKNISSFKIKHQHQVGKVLAPNNNEKKMPTGWRYGIVTAPDEDVDINNPKALLMKGLSSANKVRNSIRFLNPPFPLLDFYSDMGALDVNQTGKIKLEELSEICHNYNLKIDFDRMNFLLKQTDTLTDESKIDYMKFCSIIMPQLEFPSIEKIKDFSDEELHYETCYQASTKDLEKEVPSCDELGAGVPSVELHAAGKGGFIPLSDHCSLGIETEASTCLYPHLFVHYGLTHRDFFRPRSKEFIKKLFTRIGVELSDRVFEELWAEGMRRDQTGYVCVETFRNLLEQVVEVRFTQQFKI